MNFQTAINAKFRKEKKTNQFGVEVFPCESSLFKVDAEGGHSTD
jgi:hypothetical protein